jgi:hypothetical protein
MQPKSLKRFCAPIEKFNKSRNQRARLLPGLERERNEKIIDIT